MLSFEVSEFKYSLLLIYSHLLQTYKETLT
ncbi:hypothetical protein Smp_177390 [Schistosoma mansoni]|nr:hypothetical protein Smp_177390 [Schistosoma mansoni]|eukprot:XP_018646939.1 hypothetical protein Smp_177390 [Schistosoma mansoni]